jgi:hypothetical protein
MAILSIGPVWDPPRDHPPGRVPGPYCRLDPYGTPPGEGPRAILSIGPLWDPPWEGLPGPYCRLDPYGTPWEGLPGPYCRLDPYGTPLGGPPRAIIGLFVDKTPIYGPWRGSQGSNMTQKGGPILTPLFDPNPVKIGLK